MRGRVIQFLIMGTVAVSLTACTPRYRNHGYVPSAEDLAAVTIGVDTRETVTETLGAPSASSVLDGQGYLYVRSRIAHVGPREPQVVERQVVVIGFDANGIARNVEQYSLADGKVVPLTRRITDNGIESGGLLRQLVGNIGNFAPTGAPSGAN